MLPSSSSFSHRGQAALEEQVIMLFADKSLSAVTDPTQGEQ
jgi:hypothetical protein